MRSARLALILVAIAALAPMTVGAAIPRPAPIAPKNGATLPVGKTPTFKVRSTGTGTVWIHVSKSGHRNSEGVIANEAVIGQAHKKNGVYVLKPKFYEYPTFWAKQRRTYYWQAYRIACGEQSDCKVEGPVRTFKLR